MDAIQLRDYQASSSQSIISSLRAGGQPVVVLPTGSGKSLVIAEVARLAVERQKRIMILVHRRELCRQNAKAIRQLAPDIEVGIHSAGLKQRDCDQQVIVAGIQSVYRRAEDFGRRHLVFIDEAHLVPPVTSGGMYHEFIAAMSQLNPGLLIAGCTATPYRLGDGPIAGSSGAFSEISYTADIRKLISDGYLPQVVSQTGYESYDTSQLSRRAGEFVTSECEDLFSQNLQPVCRELIGRTRDRKSRLIFCSGVSHAKRVANAIANITGEEVGHIDGTTLPLERDSVLRKFGSREIGWLTNCDVLTVGYDAPNIDMIGILRATASPGLYVQIVGRGFRTFAGKDNFLVLDFGENISRHGPIDAAWAQEKRSSGLVASAPAKACPECRELCATRSSSCPHCGHDFPEKEKNIRTRPDDAPILSPDEPEVCYVLDVVAFEHTPRNPKFGEQPRRATMRVEYTLRGEVDEDESPEIDRALAGLTQSELRLAGYPIVSEWVCCGHPDGSFPYRQALSWWKERGLPQPMPNDANEAAAKFNASKEKFDIDRVTVWQAGAWKRIKHVTHTKEEADDGVPF